jgi:hypothetical protein
MTKILDLSLKMENIILEEFKFANAYVIQMIQDRTSTFNLYFILMGIFITGLGLIIDLNKDIIQYLPWVFIIIGTTHFFFFVRLVSLERKYHTYIMRNNEIRKFYTLQFQEKIPNVINILNPITKVRTSINLFPVFPMTMVFVLIGSICFGVAVFILVNLTFWVKLTLGIFIALISFFSYIPAYKLSSPE